MPNRHTAIRISPCCLCPKARPPLEWFRTGGDRSNHIVFWIKQAIRLLLVGGLISIWFSDPTRMIAFLFTGRIVTLTNDKIFDTPAYNYTLDFPFIWDELSFQLAIQPIVLARANPVFCRGMRNLENSRSERRSHPLPGALLRDRARPLNPAFSGA